MLNVVYVLTSDESDYYLEQLLVSLYSLRLHNADAKVYVLVDQNTYKSLVDGRSLLYSYADEVRKIDVPEHFSKVQRSRFLKTTWRQYVEGDCLFIDTDTVICENLSGICDMEGDILQTSDGNGQLIINDNHKKLIKKAQNLGYGDVTGKPFFNSGVMFVRDTEKTRKIFRDWHENWEKAIRGKNCQDQLPLLHTYEKYGFPVKELSPVWNVQIRAKGMKWLGEAKIIHTYAGSTNSLYLLNRESLYADIKKQRCIPEYAVEMIKHPRIAFENGIRVISSEDSDAYSQPLIGFILRHKSFTEVFNKLIFHTKKISKLKK